MLNVTQLLKATPLETVQRSHDVAALRMEKVFVGKTKRVRVVAKMRTQIPGQPKRPIRTVWVEGLDGTKLYKCSVRVRCTCEYWKWFGCADVLNLDGAAYPRDVTGVMPDTRNPSYRRQVCKHMVPVLKAIIRERK